jgi:DNA-binding transcriptional ArsR family regulator
MSAIEGAPFQLPERPLESEVLAKYFRGFGDPTRVRILEALAGGERSVGALVELLGEPQPKVSNHLACLRWCGFVESRRDHRTVYYRIADERVTAMLELARGLLEENAEHVAACRVIDGDSC